MPLTARYPLPPLRSGKAASVELIERRAGVTQAVSPYPARQDVTVTERVLGGVPTLVASPSGAAAGNMVYLHGGGYRLGSPQRMTGFLTLLAGAADCRVFAPAYGLAPEKPFPAALHDCAAVIEAVVAQEPEVPLLVGGDSAGGGLAAASCITFGEALPSLRGAVLLSPWLDLRVSAASYRSRAASDVLFSLTSARQAAEDYLQGLDATLPLASPMLAEVLTGMPRTLVITGTAEVLLDDTIAFVGRLADQHVGVELHIVPQMQHVFPTLFPDLQSSVEALDAITRFMRDSLVRKPSLQRTG